MRDNAYFAQWFRALVDHGGFRHPESGAQGAGIDQIDAGHHIGAMIEPAHFRNVLGAYPTGVCLITAVDADGYRSGMVVGSFTSISLAPPLVGFFPDKGSSTWPGIERAGRFCVNVLGTDQLALCRRFASKDPDKFLDLAHGESPSGQPLFDEALAWIDCEIEQIVDLGDHLLVVGKVESLDLHGGEAPLLFHRGGYHSCAVLPTD